MDGIELQEFDRDWKNRLYVLWNRMSSGSYYPKPVKGVEIPKKNGKKRLLGIPTIEDRVAQMVLRNRLEPMFHEDSYGYRPNKSALDAIATARSRCLKAPILMPDKMLKERNAGTPLGGVHLGSGKKDVRRMLWNTCLNSHQDELLRNGFWKGISRAVLITSAMDG